MKQQTRAGANRRSVRDPTGARGPAGRRGPAGARGPAGGLTASHVDRIAELRQEVQQAISHAAPVKRLQQQVQGALKQMDDLSDLRQQVQDMRKELGVQFQRIAQVQAQLDKLMAILTSSGRKDTLT
jgi:TolA-binding protein